MVAVIAALFVMIMLHEFGHFVAAKRSGMKVTEFFVGFGPRLWSFTKGETEYGVKAVPLGGYCRIIGMTNLEEVDARRRAARLPEQGHRARRSSSRLPGRRVHFVIAFVLMFAVLFFAGDYRNERAITTLAATSQGAGQRGFCRATRRGLDQRHAGDELVRRCSRSSTRPAPREAGQIVDFVVRRGGENIRSR